MSQIPTPTQTPVGNDAARCACEYGPLATRRKRVGFACKCAAWAVGPWADVRVRALLEAGRAYAHRSAPLDTVRSALGALETHWAEGERVRADAFSISEGLRAGGVRGTARSTRLALDAVRWALGAKEPVPDVPPGWGWARAALAASAFAPACAPECRTPDVLALARAAVADGAGVLPILADALQDAGCEDQSVLGHCRRWAHEHAPGCWVPDLILDAA